MHFVLFSDRGAERDFGRRPFHHVPNVVFFHPELLRNFINAWPPTQLLRQPRDFAFEAIQFMFQLWRKPEYLSIVSNRGQDGLANPPARIRNKSHAARWIETRCSLDQAHVALIN